MDDEEVGGGEGLVQRGVPGGRAPPTGALATNLRGVEPAAGEEHPPVRAGSAGRGDHYPQPSPPYLLSRVWAGISID